MSPKIVLSAPPDSFLDIFLTFFRHFFGTFCRHSPFFLGRPTICPFYNHKACFWGGGGGGGALYCEVTIAAKIITKNLFTKIIFRGNSFCHYYKNTLHSARKKAREDPTNITKIIVSGNDFVIISAGMVTPRAGGIPTPTTPPFSFLQSPRPLERLLSGVGGGGASFFFSSHHASSWSPPMVEA